MARQAYRCPIKHCKWKFSPDYHYLKHSPFETESRYVEWYLRGHLAGTHKVLTTADLQSRIAYTGYPENMLESHGYEFEWSENDLSIRRERATV